MGKSEGIRRKWQRKSTGERSLIVVPRTHIKSLAKAIKSSTPASSPRDGCMQSLLDHGVWDQTFPEQRGTAIGGINQAERVSVWAHLPVNTNSLSESAMMKDWNSRSEERASTCLSHCLIGNLFSDPPAN